MSKIDDLFDQLTGWRTVHELTVKFNWQPHTLRAAIASGAKKRGMEIERKREEGVTSYRIAPDFRPRDDFAKSIQASYDTIKERIAEGGPGWEPK